MGGESGSFRHSWIQELKLRCQLSTFFHPCPPFTMLVSFQTRQGYLRSNCMRGRIVGLSDMSIVKTSLILEKSPLEPVSPYSYHLIPCHVFWKVHLHSFSFFPISKPLLGSLQSGFCCHSLETALTKVTNDIPIEEAAKKFSSYLTGPSVQHLTVLTTCLFAYFVFSH